VPDKMPWACAAAIAPNSGIVGTRQLAPKLEQAFAAPLQWPESGRL